MPGAVGADLEALFGADSPLQEALPGFAPREGQARMAAAIAAAVDAGENLVVEAGTGTGKTLAYLVPVLLAGRKAILSTGTKTLQDQLFHRDLPVVTAAIGRPVTIVQLKGRSNYLCLHRLQGALSGADHGRQRQAELKKIQTWSLGTRSGDIVEVAGVSEESSVWSLVTSTNDNCLGVKCELYDECHVVRARQAALAADVVVVNHHLLLADLVLKDEGFGELLPGCETVIVDEAHQFADIAQSFFNVAVSSRNLAEVGNDLRSEMLGALNGSTDVERICNELSKTVADARLALGGAEAGSSLMWDAVSPNFLALLDDCIACLDTVIDWVQRSADQSPGLLRCAERAADLVDRLQQVSGGDETAGLRWVGVSRRGFSVNYTPVDVASALQKLLVKHECSWVFTSATLAVGNSFEHFITRTGLEDPRTLIIPSPFDFAAAGLLYFPPNMPEPSQPQFGQRFIAAVKPLLQVTRGRAFLLFTSHRALRAAAAELRDDPDFSYALLVQGEAPRSKLLESFAELESPVLLGTSSFWEGVDMRGEQLVLVAIDKLPFASPGDPMLKARLEAITQQGGQPFSDYQLPQAVLGLKQGVGRLIRGASDYGVVVICDPRIVTKGYGKRFLKSLPPFRVTRDEDQVVKFFEQRHRIEA